ncbi:hypothetical protein ACQ4M3_39690 [Leptolyngbya sp. AN03gr2]|uniref:hypothetical protein n=1 Tax=unclassified Leptolyngbya TaxID=2650499 RepID=UPI003D31641C
MPINKEALISELRQYALTYHRGKESQLHRHQTLKTVIDSVIGKIPDYPEFTHDQNYPSRSISHLGDCNYLVSEYTRVAGPLPSLLSWNGVIYHCSDGNEFKQALAEAKKVHCQLQHNAI